MGTSSPEKGAERFNEEDGDSLAKKMNLDSYERKEHCAGSSINERGVPHDGIQIMSNDEYASPLMPICNVNEESKFISLETNLMSTSLPVIEAEEILGANETKLGVTDIQTSNDDDKEAGKDVEDYQEQEKDDDVIETIENFVGADDLNLKHRSPLDKRDNDPYSSVEMEYYDKHAAEMCAPNETANGDFRQGPGYPCTDEIDLIEEFDYDSMKMKSSDKSEVEACYSGMEPPENGGMVWENSSLQYTEETQNVSPSPERRLSVSAERSPHTIQLPSKGATSPKQEMSSVSSAQKAPSPRPSRRRHSPSPEKPSSGYKRTSRDRSSPSTRRKSSPGRTSKGEPQRRDDSPRRHSSQSPQKIDSPRRRGRSGSRSPIRRRVSPGSRRDHRRSRSRSPIARDRSRRSPRRYSPRRRSPPHSRSRRHSPRRPWSPPANRNTGIGRPGKNLFVAGFSYVTTEKDLERKFSKFGRVTDVRIVRDRRSGDSRGFGFLSLERDEDADAAIRAVDQTEWNGRIVLVEKSKTSTR
ncbi:hypothetical protein HPP92_015979 [Vanilla planifolia]|uniref:RRM domain-containing protein n=1 Tax=Vanilla planifolia TaxID=51239 RepID=A0A835QSM3_VANPL|nr:hypothetical protein HPP92_015979 [Vanilla planifolia]